MFYAFLALITWGVFVFGIWRAREYTWYSITLFAWMLFCFFLLLTSGRAANRKKRIAEFLHSKISEKKASIEEELNKVNHDRELDE